MGFDADQGSREDSRPLELYKIVCGGTAYFLASGNIDVVYGGDTYVASTCSRGNLAVNTTGQGRELIVYLLVSHPVCQRFLAQGIPPRDCVVTVYRQQQRSGATVQWWMGFASGISADGHQAQIRVPARTDDAIKIRLPTVTATRDCPHILYSQIGGGHSLKGAACQVDRNASSVGGIPFKNTTTIASFAGATLVVAGVGTWPDQWGFAGEIVHAPTGERRTILSQIGTTLILNVPFFGLTAGDAVDLFAGCTHDLSDSGCGFDKFNNVPNFGGAPDLPSRNTFSVGGVGVIQS